MSGITAFSGVKKKTGKISGKLRFRKPLPVNFTDSLRSAKRMGPSCLQLNEDLPSFPWLPEKNTSFSEDCLSLNVWTPHTGKTGSAKLPVVVFLHGGGFRSGGSSLEVYDGEISSRSRFPSIRSLKPGVELIAARDLVGDSPSIRTMYIERL